MTDVAVRILHAEPPASAGPLVAATAGARRAVAERHVAGFLAAGASSARIVAGPADDRPFGVRLREVVDAIGAGGLVILGSGAVPLATAADRRAFIAAAGGDRPRALTNNRYSADIVAIAQAREALREVPDLATDNALPRWLAESAEIPVEERRTATRLGIDIDGPLDLVLLGGSWSAALPSELTARVEAALARVRAVVRDPRAELVVAGRVSAANLAWLERHTAARTRALIEERGLRTRRPGQRPAASVLGAVLDRDGADALAAHLAALGEAAIVDSRVLLAHRFGAGAEGWPAAEDRFASDLLLHERIVDPWLQALTRSAAMAAIPIVLGGHTLVGPGLRRALAPTGRVTR